MSPEVIASYPVVQSFGIRERFAGWQITSNSGAPDNAWNADRNKLSDWAPVVVVDVTTLSLALSRVTTEGWILYTAKTSR